MESSTSGPGASTTGQAQEKVQQVAGQAQEKAQEAAGQAKGQLRTQVDQRSTQAGEQVSTTASDIRSVADQLREQGKDQPAKLAEQAADRAERLGGYLKDNDADRILGDIEDFGRRQPWVVIAGGMTLGLVASRFLKASASNRYEQRSRSQSYGQLPARTSGTSTAGVGYSDPVTGTTVPRTTPAYDTASGFEGSR
jgi:gas vesicle protein